jgi:integrase/recombinase XerD
MVATALAIPSAPTRRLTKAAAVVVRSKSKRQALPEYLEKPQIDALYSVLEDPRHRLHFLLQWRAGLRVAEACAIAAQDLFLEGAHPTLKVRRGKGNRARIVPVHEDLRTALMAFTSFGDRRQADSLLGVSESQAWRWVKGAYARAVAAGKMPAGKKIGTHTLRHSAARHWLLSGVPINVVSRWLGHSNLATTLIYLAIVPDVEGFMDRVT